MALIDNDFIEVVSDYYVDIYYNNRINEISHNAPYNFAFLNDFWRPEFYELLCEYNHSLSISYKPDGEENVIIYHEPYDLEPFLRFVYGQPFKVFLASLVGLSTFIRPKECYPQLRATKSSASGLSIHTDENAPYNGIAIFHLNNCWVKGDGGEFVVWENISEGKYKKCYEYAPLGNSLSVLLLGKKSFHSVNTSNGDWVRKNILMEVDFQ